MDSRATKGWKREPIAPWELTSNWEANPVVALDAPRPDFNGALIQFLSAWFKPRHHRKMISPGKDLFDEPPSSEQLRDTFRLSPMHLSWEETARDSCRTWNYSTASNGRSGAC